MTEHKVHLYGGPLDGHNTILFELQDEYRVLATPRYLADEAAAFEPKQVVAIYLRDRSRTMVRVTSEGMDDVYIYRYDREEAIA